jgi:hypothetical protein
MAMIEAIEGSTNDARFGGLWFHYDVRNDVLYIRLLERRDDEVHGEETDDGFVMLRTIDNDDVAGMTVVNWWKRFGQGQMLPDSMGAIAAKIEPWTKRLAAA